MIVVSQTVHFTKREYKPGSGVRYGNIPYNDDTFTNKIDDETTPKILLFSGLGLFVIGGILIAKGVNRKVNNNIQPNPTGKYCSNCGNQIEVGVIFCSKCGNKV